MKIAGIQKNSFVDYPGKLAAVVFTPGCNMDCYYCHNWQIVRMGGRVQLYDPGEFLKLIEARKSFLDGVVISGGEPTLQPGLADFIGKIRNIGYPVKLDTNGSNPVILKDILAKGLLNYVAMDIKAPLSRYEEICGVPVSTEDITTSIGLLKKGGIDYEFRTTFVPRLSVEDIKEIAQLIRGARLYVLQQYRKPDTKGNVVDYRILEPPHPPETIREAVRSIQGVVERCETRGI